MSWVPFSALLPALMLASCLQRTSQEGFDFVVLADTAYVVPDDYPAYYALIDRINRLSPAFTIHLGDVIGPTVCSDQALQRVKSDFGKFDHPLVYTPGDNEWTDCGSESGGSYDPVERLAFIRGLFFHDAATPGNESLAMQRQAESGAGLVENVLWTKDSVLFATVHIVGSNNGLSGAGANAEFASRNQANRQWLEEVFSAADVGEARAIVLAFHANMHAPPATPDGFSDMRTTIGELGGKFARPVLLLHGDHHLFVIDRPYGYDLGNITRLQTFGWPDAKAVRVHVDPSSASPFSFQAVYAGDGLYGGAGR